MDTQERGRADRAEATRKIREADKEVVRIYRKALDDMTRKARAAGEGTASRRWAEEMQRTYRRRISEMAGDIEGTITDAMQETAGIPARSGAERMSEIYSKAGGRLSAETFSDMYARVPEEAIRAVISGRAYLDGKSLSGRIWTQAGRLEGGINEIIKQGLAQQKGTAEIARELEQYVNPSAHETIAERRERVKRQAALPFAGNIEYNCQRLARTSINHALFLATKEYAALSPFCKAIHWELSDDHFERQVLPFGADICDEYATHDEGLGIGNWPVEGVPLPHAQCLCCQWPEESGTLDECAERLGAWLSGGEDAELDKAYGQWKDAMISGLPNARLGEIRDDAGEERARMLKQIAGREDVKALSVSERERLFNELNNASNKELDTLQNIDKMARSAIIEVGNLLKSKDNRQTVHITAADGTIVTRYTGHLAERMEQRSVNDVEIYNGLSNPLHICDDVTDSLGRTSRRFIGRYATVNINPESGTIVTAWRTGSATVRKWTKDV